MMLMIAIGYSNIGGAQDFKTVGYLPTYRFYAIDDIEWDKITHLNIAFANPNSQGILQTDGVSIAPVARKAHDAGLEVYIALAGASSPLSVWENWITPSNRSSFIHGIVAYVMDHELRGVDVDLEWGTVNDDYSGFVLELKDSLDQHDLGLSAALPGTYRYPEITAEALAAFDWVNLMVYDLTGPWDATNPGPHSPYSFSETSISYWSDQGLERSRMTLGVPFYGYDFTNSGNITAVTFAEMVERDDANAQKDQVGKIYYNGLPTIQRKTKLALEELSGIMVWELGQDHFGPFSLLSKIHETIKGNITTHNSEIEQPLQSLPYPNPVADFVSVSLDSPVSTIVTLSSVSDNVHHTFDYENKTELRIDMSNYSKGIYFLNIKNKGLSTTYKLVKF